MRPDELEFRFALDALARPDDPLPRMAYADWLTERDDPRGELLRLRCLMASDPGLARQERELSERPGLVWMDHGGLPLTEGLFLRLFRRSLAEAVAWYRMVSPVIHTSELRVLPPPGPARPFAYGEDKHWQATADRALRSRTELLDTELVAAAEAAAPEGRLVCYWPNNNLCDEASMAYSSYFDQDNCPPWDVWVWYAREDMGHSRDPLLVSWVPPEYVVEVNNGIMANPEECICWAANRRYGGRLTDALRRAGLAT